MHSSFEYDLAGRPIAQTVKTGLGRESYKRSYHWNAANQLVQAVNQLDRKGIIYTYDELAQLVSATGSIAPEYKCPDAVGNLFKTPGRKDRQYDKGGKLLKDEKYHYHYDAEGNLIFKEFITSSQPNIFDKRQLQKKLDITLKGSGVGWIYDWAGNGMLQSVTLPMGSKVKFNYDPLGRRIAKQYKGKTTRWLWDGNVPLHEWQYEGDYPPKLSIDETDSLKETQEPTENVITWLFEENSFVPCAKIVGEEKYSIVCDYLGTPTHAYNEEGSLIWERELDIYGSLRKGNNEFVPFLYQGQYVDKETGLAYNRMRYYSNESGMYLSQDPIGIVGGLQQYAYVHDTNVWLDVFGLTRGARVDKLPKHLQRRPKWRQSTFDYLKKNNPMTADGKYINVKTGLPIELGDEIIGHQNQSWREYQEDPANAKKTRAQVIDEYNDVNNLGFEDKKSSSSDGGKFRGHEH